MHALPPRLPGSIVMLCSYVTAHPSFIAIGRLICRFHQPRGHRGREAWNGYFELRHAPNGDLGNEQPLDHVVERHFRAGRVRVEIRFIYTHADRTNQKLRQFDHDALAATQTSCDPFSVKDDFSQSPSAVTMGRLQYRNSMVTMQGVTRRDHRSAEAAWFGSTVRRLREERALTQAQLAEASDLSATYLGIVERGENVPTLTVILQIAAGLDLHPMELFREFRFKSRR